MFGKLLPQETNFFDFFEQHAALIVRATQMLLAMVSQEVDIAHQAKQIKELEREADSVRHHCIEALHKTFITPIERDEIFRLISSMDKIVDDIEAAARCISAYKLKHMTPEARDFANVLIQAVLEVELGLKGLRDMKNAANIKNNCHNISRLESEADQILLVGVSRLFEEEKDILNIIKWKEIYEDLEMAADRCKDVSNILEGILLEYA